MNHLRLVKHEKAAGTKLRYNATFFNDRNNGKQIQATPEPV